MFAYTHRLILSALGQGTPASIAFCTALAGIPTPVFGQDNGAALNIVNISAGTGLSQVAAGMSLGGYELADGTWTSFHGWYHTDWPEMHIDFMSQTSANFGVLWGFGTGEQGAKYTIDPSLRLGFVAQMQPTETSALTLTLNTIWGGRFNESPCEADFGSIGGTQTVNCRLAASHLAPAETLQYLAAVNPTRVRATLNFRASF